MLLRLSRASDIGEIIFIHSDEIYKGSASLKTSPPEWSPLCEEKSTAWRFKNEKRKLKKAPNGSGPAYIFAVQPVLHFAIYSTFWGFPHSMNAAARCLRSLPDGMTRAFCWRWRGMGRPTLVPFFLRFLRLACAWGPSILQRCSSWPPSCPSIWWFLSSICSNWRLLVWCRALLDLSRPEVHCLRVRRFL